MYFCFVSICSITAYSYEFMFYYNKLNVTVCMLEVNKCFMIQNSVRTSKTVTRRDVGRGQDGLLLARHQTVKSETGIQP